MDDREDENREAHSAMRTVDFSRLYEKIPNLDEYLCPNAPLHNQEKLKIRIAPFQDILTIDNISQFIPMFRHISTKRYLLILNLINQFSNDDSLRSTPTYLLEPLFNNQIKLISKIKLLFPKISIYDAIDYVSKRSFERASKLYRRLRIFKVSDSFCEYSAFFQDLDEIHADLWEKIVPYFKLFNHTIAYSQELLTRITLYTRFAEDGHLSHLEKFKNIFDLQKMTPEELSEFIDRIRIYDLKKIDVLRDRLTQASSVVAFSSLQSSNIPLVMEVNDKKWSRFLRRIKELGVGKIDVNEALAQLDTLISLTSKEWNRGIARYKEFKNISHSLMDVLNAVSSFSKTKDWKKSYSRFIRLNESHNNVIKSVNNIVSIFGLCDNFKEDKAWEGFVSRINLYKEFIQTEDGFLDVFNGIACINETAWLTFQERTQRPQSKKYMYSAKSLVSALSHIPNVSDANWSVFEKSLCLLSEKCIDENALNELMMHLCSIVSKEEKMDQENEIKRLTKFSKSLTDAQFSAFLYLNHDEMQVANQILRSKAFSTDDIQITNAMLNFMFHMLSNHKHRDKVQSFLQRKYDEDCVGFAQTLFSVLVINSNLNHAFGVFLEGLTLHNDEVSFIGRNKRVLEAAKAPGRHEETLSTVDGKLFKINQSVLAKCDIPFVQVSKLEEVLTDYNGYAPLAAQSLKNDPHLRNLLDSNSAQSANKNASHISLKFRHIIQWLLEIKKDISTEYPTALAKAFVNIAACTTGEDDGIMTAYYQLARTRESTVLTSVDQAEDQRTVEEVTLYVIEQLRILREEDVRSLVCDDPHARSSVMALLSYDLNFVSPDAFPVFDIYLGDGQADDKQTHLDNFYIKHKSRLLSAVLDTYNSDSFRAGKLSTLGTRNWLVTIFFANVPPENLEKYVELDEMSIPQKITPLGAQKILQEVGYLVPCAG